MDEPRIIINYGGIWDGDTYKGGRADMVLVPSNINYESLVFLVHKTVRADLTYFVYDIRTLYNTHGRNVRFKIESDRDLQFVLKVGNIVYELFVTVELHTQQQVTQCSLSAQLNHRESFVELIASQCASASCSQYMHGIDPFFQLRSLAETAAEQLLNEKSDRPKMVENDFMDPSGDYSALDCGYPSGDEHVDKVKFEDHIDEVQVDQIARNVTIHESSDYMAEDKKEKREWVIPGSADVSFETVPTMIESTSEHALYKGAMFMSKEEIKMSLGMLALNEKFEYKIKRSSKTRFYASCKHIGCTFLLRAIGIQGGSCWTVAKFVKDHSCQVDMLSDVHRQVPTKVIGAIISPKLGQNVCLTRAVDLIGHVRADHGIDILYSKAWRVKEYAENIIYGDPVHSFQLLPSYFYLLEKENPGTVTKLLMDKENRFEYAFMSLGPSITGFKECCRPVIVIDGTHLKGKFRGVLFVAAAKDGNEQIYPIAFGVGDKENDRSWSWFLTELRHVIGSPKDLLIISDGHISIKNAIINVFPDACHGLCTFHLKKILKQYRSEQVVTIFENVSRVYRKSDFQKQMKQLNKCSPKAYQKLTELGIERWSRAFCPVRRYELMTSNIAENINSLLRHARKLPICSLIEFIRDRLQKWFYERREDAASIEKPLSPTAFEYVQKSLDASQHMNVLPVDKLTYHVKGLHKERLVNLKRKSCTCRRFQLDLLPCAHAAAAIRYANHDLFAYCADFFKKDTLVQMYSGRIFPVCHPDDWDVPASVKAQVVTPPVITKQAGRPKIKRIPSAGERVKSRKQSTCSRCKQPGHNRVNCMNTVSLVDDNQYISEPSLQ